MNTAALSPEPNEPATSVPDPRRLHYGEFYQLRAPVRAHEVPTVAVVGNCQAESLRILLDSTGAVNSFRIPAIHEWTAEDVELMADVLAATDVLVMHRSAMITVACPVAPTSWRHSCPQAPAWCATPCCVSTASCPTMRSSAPPLIPRSIPRWSPITICAS